MERLLRSSTSSQRLGTLLEILTRSSACPFCALVRDSVEEQRGPQVLDDGPTEQELQQAVCTVVWEIDGREAASAPVKGSPRDRVRGLTRRIHLRWNDARLSDAYLVYIAPETVSSWTASDADRVWDKESLFLGRNVPQHSENQTLIKSWLDLCQATHRRPCRLKKEDGALFDRFYDMISHSYFGVIDVQNMQLTELPYTFTPRVGRSRPKRRHEPFVALSYVWGKGEDVYTTLTGNVMYHLLHGGLEKVLHKLPRVIQDAISLVQRLGFQYLWIDRLCIVQNSPHSWKLNAYNMDLIYGNAELTICAADGDASAGLRAMRSESHNTQQYSRRVCPGTRVLVKLSPEMYIRASQWNERAWTFQERLLSRRSLIFTNGRVYFQCRSTGMSEDIYSDRQGAGWSLDLVDAPMQMFQQINNRAIWVYMRCAELYTERNLTQAKDILAAFSGMSNLMQGCMSAPFIHGLPSSHFDLALLWEPIRSGERRAIKKTAETEIASVSEFPSWSWAGWVGSVAYKESIVGGVLDNVSDWLDKHTWIKWWIRDGHGDLRPLWDNRESTVDKSEDPKWRGYQLYSREKTVVRWMRGPGNNERYDPDAVPGRVGQVRVACEESADRKLVWSWDREGWEEEDDRSVDENRTRSDSDGNPYDRYPRYERNRRDRHSHRIWPPNISRSKDGSDDDGEEDSEGDDDKGSSAESETVEIAIQAPENRGQAKGDTPILPSGPRRRSPPPFEPFPTPDDKRRSRYATDGKGYRQKPPVSRIVRQVPYFHVPPVRRRNRSRSRSRSPAGHYYEADLPHRRRERKPTRTREKENERDSDNEEPGSAFFDMIFSDDGRDFSITLKDYPYRVVKALYEPDLNSAEFPLLPILQFRTWHTWLQVKPATGPGLAEPGIARGQGNNLTGPVDDIGRGQVRCHLADEAGDWCGSIVLDGEWLSARGSSSRHEFIAISEAKSFTMAECRTWTYYIPKERDQSEWDLFYVLLIERKDEKWERVGLGKVFREAFRNARWKEIMLG